MYISLDWVNELVGIKKIKLDELIEKLTLGGFEVEEVLEMERNNNKQIVLDISATANRADSLSIKGISKEIKALLNKKSQTSNYSTSQYNTTTDIQKSLLKSEKYSDYSTFIGMTVENITDLTVPNWLKDKLYYSGVEPLNNILDFQNFILLETGYPIEFYDLKKISDKVNNRKFNLTLKSADKNTIFKAVNDTELNLNPNILVLEANNYPIAIAGIISNKEVECDESTTSLFIEASIYNSKKIRQESRILGIRTERSARYEKGINDSDLMEAIERLIYLLKLSNPNLVCKIHTTSKIKENEIPEIILNYDNIIEILGPVLSNENDNPTYLTSNQIVQYLTRLNFDFSFDNKKNLWNVKVPLSRRNDIEREIDLIEEVGRLHGFNNFVTALPSIERVGNEDFSYQTRKKITNCLINEGFNELIQYSLVNEQLPETIPLVNPLLVDCSTLRTSLLPNLIETAKENLKQNSLFLEGFEYGHIFLNDGKDNYNEQENLAGLFGGLKSKTEWNESATTLSWFEAKGKIEDIFFKLNIPIIWNKYNEHRYKSLLHPYRTAELLLLDGTIIGVFGQIHPLMAKNKNLVSELFLFEFNFEVLKSELQKIKLPMYQTYSSYPKIVKDLSFIVDQTISFDQIQKTIFEASPTVLTNLKLLDEYRGASIPKGQTSLCIQLIFQSTEKTLMTKEVETIVNDLQTLLVTKYGILLRS